jgi:hypothetical protein
MAEMTLGKLITYILIGFFLLIFLWALYNHEGFFNKVAEYALGAEKFINMETSPEVKATPLPAEITGARDKLLNELVGVAQQPKTDCLMPLSDLSGLKEYQIELTQSAAEMRLTILDPKNQGNVRYSSAAGNAHICVINPLTFYVCFWENPQCPRTVQPIHYKDPPFTFSAETLGNYAVKTTTGKVCIFPKQHSIFSCAARENGLDDDCFPQLPSKLPLCSQIAVGTIR